MKKLVYNKALDIVSKTFDNGGYSHKEYNDGYMVSIKGTEVKLDTLIVSFENIARIIQKFANKHNTVNTWLDSNILYMDVSVNIEDLNDALEFARENNELAINDCTEDNVIKL